MIRRQNLEEWFLQYQLDALARNHFFLPASGTFDITELSRAYAAQGLRPPLTAIVVKAAGMMAREYPEVNRVVLATPLGTRVVQFEEAHVNLPVVLEHAGQPHLTATVVRQANLLSVPEIVAEIRKAQTRPLADLPISRMFIKNRNTAFNRMQLRLRHAAAYGIPALYARFGGGISVASMLRPQVPGMLMHQVSYGPTALTLCPGALATGPDGRTTLHLSIGYDHYAVQAPQAVRAVARFGQLLVEGDPKLFGPFTEAASTSSNPSAPLVAQV